MSSLLAACGGSSSTNPKVSPSSSSSAAATSAAAPTNVDPSGVLRIAADMTAASAQEQLDPMLGAPGAGAFGILGATVFGTPIRVGVKPGTFDAWLAKSYAIPDPSTFVLKLRDGLTFQDGTPYDAPTLRDVYLKKRDSGKAPLNLSMFKLIRDITADDPTTLTFHLSSPVAGLMPNLLSGPDGTAVSTKTTDPLHPIGAGPYQLVSYDLAKKLVLKRWDGFVDAKKYLLANIEVDQATAGDPALNALIGGQVDLAIVDPTVVARLKSQGSFDAVITPLEAYYWIPICKRMQPFDDPRVRRALDISIDRKAINDALNAGLATPQVGLWPAGDPRAVPSIESNLTPDLQTAKSLLAQAGATNLSFTIVPTGSSLGQSKLAELVQAQWAKIGVKVSILPTTNAFQDIYGKSPKGALAIQTWFNGGAQKILMQFADPTAAYNVCQYQDATLNQIGTKIAGLDPNDPAAVDLWHQADQIVHDQALNIAVTTQVAVLGINSNRVKGLMPGCTAFLSGRAPCPRLEGVYIAK